MKNTQEELSIQFILDNVPGFIRELYQTFIILEKEIYSQLQVAFKAYPSSVVEYVRSLQGEGGTVSFFQIFKYIMGGNNQIAIQNIIEDTLYKYNQYERINIDEERLFNIDGGDILAPLTSIKEFVSTIDNPSFDHMPPAICIEPEVKDHCRRISNIANNLGVTSMFESLESTIKIDVNHVFSYFFHHAFSYRRTHYPYPYPNPYRDITDPQTYGEKIEGENTTITDEMLWRGYFEENSEKLFLGNDEAFNKEQETMLKDYTAIVVNSAILTYLIYAGKLIGTKEDLYRWAYTAFVKDSVDELEKGGLDYKSINITSYTGQQLNNETDELVPGSRTLTDKDIRDRNELLYKQYPESDMRYNPSIIYKYLRLNYSNWSTCMDLITKMSNTDLNHRARSIDDKYDSLIRVAQKILQEYISHSYAVYNVYSFNNLGKGISLGGYFIDFASKRLFDPFLKAQIRSSLEESPGYNKGDTYQASRYFLSEKTGLATIKSVELLGNFLADLFLMVSYTVMLYGIYKTKDNILNEKDAITGKSKRDVFEEVYFSLLKKLQNTLYEPTWKIIAAVINTDTQIENKDWHEGAYNAFNGALREIYGPFIESKSHEKNHITTAMRDIRSVLDRLDKPITIKYNLESNEESRLTHCTRLITELYDIHPLSTIVELSEYYKYNNISMTEREVADLERFTDKDKNIFSRANSRFPKAILPAETFVSGTYIPNLFSSLESLSEFMSNEDSILGSNAGYSYIGQLGGSITDQEDLVNNDSLLPEDVSKIEFASEAYTAIDKKVKETLINGIVSDWNEMFKKYVLGGKEIKVPK
jgi:hypothetical protein